MKKRHFLFIPIITMGIFAISCTNTFDEQLIQENQQMPTTRSMGDGKYQVLGYGYDITEEYLSRQAIKYAVLDIDKFVQRNPKLYKVEYIGEIQDHVYGGDDYMMYSKEIIRNNKFSGSVAEKVKKANLIKEIFLMLSLPHLKDKPLTRTTLLPKKPIFELTKSNN